MTHREEIETAVGQAMSELEKLEADIHNLPAREKTSGELMAQIATLRRERDEANYRIGVMMRVMDQQAKTIAAFVVAAQKAQQQKRDPWGYEEALARSARNGGKNGH